VQLRGLKREPLHWDARGPEGPNSTRWKRRHSILAVLLATYLLCYMDRMAIATAIPFIAREFGLSPLGMGGVLSAFFMSYAVMQFPGGLLADKFGPRPVMAASVAGWSLFTLLTGVAGSITSLLWIRFLFGLSEGSFSPSASKTVALCFPPGSVGRANGLQLAAMQIGAAASPLFVSWVIAVRGWRAVFFSLFAPGVILTVLVLTIVKVVNSSEKVHVDSAEHPPTPTSVVLRTGPIR